MHILDLQDYIPEGQRHLIDLKEILFQEMILRELDFRNWVKEKDWSEYKDGFVAIHCSTDAIIPQWAYMIIASKLEGIASHFVIGNQDSLEKDIFRKSLFQNLKGDNFKDAPIVVKGCAEKQVPTEAYLWITEILKPFVKSIMYGEPCSTVPVYNAPKKM